LPGGTFSPFLKKLKFSRQLRQQRICIDSQDLRSAALALLYGFTVVTSNVRDFSQVPNLSVADWTVTHQ